MAEKLGSSISLDLSNQIKAREAKFGAATRDKATLEYLNSNSAWVKLRSSVNIIGGDVAKKLRADCEKLHNDKTHDKSEAACRDALKLIGSKVTI